MSFEFLHIVRHARERAAERRRTEREHQLALLAQATKALEVLVDGNARQVEESTKALIEIAKSNAAQAQAFTTWIQSFQITSPPTTSVVTDEDEWRQEQGRLAESLGLPSDIESLPEEFRLAASLRHDFLADVRGDKKA